MAEVDILPADEVAMAAAALIVEATEVATIPPGVVIVVAIGVDRGAMHRIEISVSIMSPRIQVLLSSITPIPIYAIVSVQETTQGERESMSMTVKDEISGRELKRCGCKAEGRANINLGGTCVCMYE